MNKFFKISGVALLFIVGTVFAVMVNYLSNTAEVNVQVDSPIILGVSNAEVGMDVDCEYTEVLSPGPLLLDDISNISLRVKNVNYCSDWMGPLVDTPVNVGCVCYNDHCDILADIDYVPSDKEQYELNLTFANIAPDDYTFEHTIQLE